MVIPVIHDNPQFHNRIKYVFDFINRHPLNAGSMHFEINGKVKNGKAVYYQSQSLATEGSFFIPAQRALFTLNLVDASSLVANAYSFGKLRLHSVETKNSLPRDFFAGASFGFDLVEAIFFHISRYEEHFCSKEKIDTHHRMKSEEQFLVKHHLQRIPVVDHMVFCFLKVLGLHPKELATSYQMTHDIDLVRRFSWKLPLRSTAKYLFSSFNSGSLSFLWKTYLITLLNGSKDPYYVFDELIAGNQEAPSVFYFLVGGTTRYDKPFPIIDANFRQLIQVIQAKGFEIGIHPSYAAWDSELLFLKEKSLLESITGRAVTKSRQHYLHFSFDQTPSILEMAKMKEDSTLGFYDRIGFRCGTGFSYSLYNFSTEVPYNFLETPMVAMDIALLREGNFQEDEVQKIWDEFLIQNSRLTCITFDFHNSRFFDAALDGVDLWKLYSQVA